MTKFFKDVLALVTGNLGVFLAGGLLLAALAAPAVMLMRQRDALEKQVAELEKQINEPGTGWSARLGACQASQTALQTSIDRRNAEIDEQGRQAAEEIKRLQGELGSSSAAVQKWQDRAAVLAAGQTAGADQCSRFIEVDKQILESLK